MEMGRSSLRLALLIPAIIVSFYGEPATANAHVSERPPPPPDTNGLCASACGTCPTVCPSIPTPFLPPSPPAAQQPQGKGGILPSDYYYFFTAGTGRSCAMSSVYYTFLLLALLPVVAV